MMLRDFSERPVNDKRPTKPPRKPKVMLKNLIPTPDCHDYMTVDAAVMDIPKPQHTEIRGIIPEKKKVPRGWPTCLKRSPQKWFFITMIYMQNTQIAAKTTMKNQRRGRHKGNMVLKKRT